MARDRSARRLQIAPSFVDVWKRAALGRPMINDELRHEELSNPFALGAFSPGAISSTAYGPSRSWWNCCRSRRVQASAASGAVVRRSIDPAQGEALRYAKGLHADVLTAVHFVMDAARAARLQVRCTPFSHTMVTVLLSRRMYSPLADRLLHDRTADKMARAISRGDSRGRR